MEGGGSGTPTRKAICSKDPLYLILVPPGVVRATQGDPQRRRAGVEPDTGNGRTLGTTEERERDETCTSVSSRPSHLYPARGCLPVSSGGVRPVSLRHQDVSSVGTLPSTPGSCVPWNLGGDYTSGRHFECLVPLCRLLFWFEPTL